MLYVEGVVVYSGGAWLIMVVRSLEFLFVFFFLNEWFGWLAIMRITGIPTMTYGITFTFIRIFCAHNFKAF